MPIADEVLFRDRTEILEGMISEFQSLVPDVYLGLDGNLRLLFEVLAGVGESGFLAMQVLSDDMFVATANITALYRHGEQYGVFPKSGSVAAGLVKFTGAADVLIPAGTEVAYESFPGSGQYFFATTEDGTIPNPGDASAPTTVANAAAGNPNGSYEYGITFVTSEGETALGATSTPLSVVSKKIDISAIPLGGSGTIARRIYRRLNATGDFKFVAEISDNTTTTYQDNIAEGSLGAVAPAASTALAIQLAAASEDYGARYNVAPGAISILVSVPDGITDVTNPDYFTGGSDPELTEAYRQRLLASLRNPSTGSATDLKTWAESHDGVSSATVFPNDNLGTPSPGHVTVRLSGPDGTIPDSEKIAEVQADLDSRDLANIVIHVSSYDPVVTNVDVDVTVSSEFTVSDVTPSVQSAVANYINNLEVGDTLYLSGVVDAVFGLVGILDVAVTSPGSNVTVAADEKHVAGVITVT